MNININYGNGTVLSGFINLDPLTDKETDNLIRCDIRNLDEICENAECEQLIAEDVVSYFHFNEINEIMSNWISKLRHGGIMIIGGTDLSDTSRLLTTKRIDVMDANKILFGEADKTRKSSVSPKEMCAYLEGYGLKVLSKKLMDSHYMIKVVRP